MFSFLTYFQDIRGHSGFEIHDRCYQMLKIRISAALQKHICPNFFKEKPRWYVPVYGSEAFEVDGEDVRCVDVMNAAFSLHQVSTLLARVLVVSLETLYSRERLVQERERVLWK